MQRDRTSRISVAAFRRRYLAALRAHSRPAAEPLPGPAKRLGLRAHELGIESRALAGIHHIALATLPPPADGARGRRKLALRAASLLATALQSLETARRAAGGPPAGRGRPGATFDRAAVELAAAHRRTSREGDRRRTAEEALSTSEGHERVLLARSRTMEEQLRQLSRRLLRSHEEERRLISRELHDALGQTLAGINVGLTHLASAAAGTSKGLSAEIGRTRRLVERSMKTVHQFARDLRPTLLDDLGLVPALVSLARDFGRKSGIRVRLSAAEESVGLDNDRRTALFRVAQEALINVDRHAGARNVKVNLRRLPGAVRMEVWNDGRTFDVERMRDSRRNRRLGILCMQERVEMVGGKFAIESTPARGTTVRAEVPVPTPA